MAQSCEIVRLVEKNDIKLARMLINKYHVQGARIGGGASSVQLYYAYLCKDSESESQTKYITAVAWLNDSKPFRYLAEIFDIPMDKSLFIRRVVKTAPGSYLVDFLVDLQKHLAENGFEVLWTLGLPEHSNSAFRKAGFKEVGRTQHSGHPVFVAYLKGQDKTKSKKSKKAEIEVDEDGEIEEF